MNASQPLNPLHVNDPISVWARDLTRRFGAFMAVDHITIEVSKGEIFGFLGSNGAGKTTTIRMLCGLLRPDSGQAQVAGLDVFRRSADIKRKIGYMSQKFSLYADLTVRENLRFWGGTYGLFGKSFRKRRDWAMEAMDLHTRASDLVCALPGGYRQRLALACALLHQPPIVFLDEPTGGVDPQARRRFWDIIEELSAAGITVFVTTHYMDEAERCHRVALMHAGRILALDTVDQLRAIIPKGRFVHAESPKTAELFSAMHASPLVSECSLFGTRVHALLKPQTTPQDLKTVLLQHGLETLQVSEAEPSLEDVFIRVIQDASTEVEP